MKMRKSKSRLYILKFKNYPPKVKNCLNPNFKKQSAKNIFNNSKEIKNLLASYDSKNILNSPEHKVIKNENDYFQKNMDNFHSNKNKNNQDSKKEDEEDPISQIIKQYTNKGYKVPNIRTKNIFNRNPLNLKGIGLLTYYEQISLNQKKLIPDNEKNLVYLRKTSKYLNSVKNFKIMEKKGFNSQEIKPIKTMEEKIEEKIGEKKKSKNFLSRKSTIKKRTYCLTPTYFKEAKRFDKLIDENEKLSLEDKKKLKKLNIETQDLKKYFNYVLNDLSENDFSKQRNFSEKYILKKKLPKMEKISENLNNFNDSTNYKMNISNRKEDRLLSDKNNLEKIPKKNVINFKISPKSSRNIINAKIIIKQDSPKNNNKERGSCIELKQSNNNINNNIIHIDRKPFKQKTQYYPNKKFNIINYQNKATGKLRAKHRTLANVYIYDNNKNNNNNYQRTKNRINSNSTPKVNRDSLSSLENNIRNNFYKFRTKEELLDYLFNNISKNTELGDNFISVFKKYFLRHTKINEHELNLYIKKKYEPNDFYNFCNSIERKVANQNTISLLKKNFMKLDRLIERKDLFNKADKIDYYILHLYHNFISAIEGQRKFIDLK